MKTQRNMAVVVAAGSGSRMNNEMPKQFMDLAGRPVVAFSLGLLERCSMIDEVILVVAEEYLSYASKQIVDRFSFKKVNKITTGGETRQESVLAGLTACSASKDLVVIHDAARPFLTMDLLEQVVHKAGETDAAILAVPAKESVKQSDGRKVVRTLKRETVWMAQTPQVFGYDRILEAHRRGEAAEYEATDDSELYEQYIGPVSVVMGSYQNIKITTSSDFALAREIVREMA